MNRLLVLIAILPLACSPANSDEYHYIDFASCKWRIPTSYKVIGDMSADEFRYAKKRLPSESPLAGGLLVFHRQARTKDSFGHTERLQRDFRMFESQDYLLVKYKMLIRVSDEVIGEGPQVTTLVERKTGHSVTLEDLELSDFVSNCEIPTAPATGGND